MPLTEAQRASLDGKGVDWRRVAYAEPSEVLDALGVGDALLVDTRARDAHLEDHFPGALHWRGPRMEPHPPRERRLYLYCT